MFSAFFPFALAYSLNIVTESDWIKSPSKAVLSSCFLYTIRLSSPRERIGKPLFQRFTNHFSPITSSTTTPTSEWYSLSDILSLCYPTSLPAVVPTLPPVLIPPFFDHSDIFSPISNCCRPFSLIKLPFSKPRRRSSAPRINRRCQRLVLRFPWKPENRHNVEQMLSLCTPIFKDC